jgi:FkbM family methyltransferase
LRELPLHELATMTRYDAEVAIRARVQTIYLGEQQVLTRVLGRPKLFLSTTDLGFAGHVMLDGYWEIWLTLFFARNVRPGMTVVDVGANFGYYTILLGDSVGASGRVIAVEPVPSTASLLDRSVQLNGHSGRTQIVRAALGRDASGEAHLIIPAGEPKNATVVPHKEPGTITVPTTNLDTLAEGLDRLDLVKIDAEGAEVNILAGMEKTIARLKPAVLLEFNAARYPDGRAFLDQLKKLFYRIRALNFDAALVDVTDADLLGTQLGEDWLLYLEAKP